MPASTTPLPANYLADIIEGFRADPAGRYGGKDRMETRPTKLDAAEILKLADGLRYAQTQGMPPVSPEMLVNKILVEGRADAGTNEYNGNNPRARALYQNMRGMGYDELSATFAAAVLDKTEVAKRTGRTFDEVWNGVGKSRETGRTGKQHSDRAAESKYAATSPKNAQLLELVTRTINSGRTPKEAKLADLNARDQFRELFDGHSTTLGTVPQSDTQLQQKIIGDLVSQSFKAKAPDIPRLQNATNAVSSAPRDIWRQMVQNLIRDSWELPRHTQRNAGFSATDRTLMEILSGIPSVRAELVKAAGQELAPPSK